MNRKPLAVLFAAGGPAAAAAVGGVGSRRAPQVYADLDKPRWAPPASVFGPVWSVLYASLGVVGWRLWTRGAPRSVLAVHGLQLTLNAAWPWAFFASRNRSLALGVIAGLDLSVAAEIADVARTDRVAAALLGPYLSWCLYATALNAGVSEPEQH